MPENNQIVRPYTLIFPDCEAFGVDDVLNFILAIEYPRDDDSNSFDRNEEARNEYKAYLIERLLEAVLEKKFELWDMNLRTVIPPPIRDSGEPTKLLANSPKQSLAEKFWQFLTKKYSSPPEPSFIKALKTSTVAQHKHHTRLRYKTDFWWARMTCILRSDLVKFCNAERILATFENKSEKTSEQQDNRMTIMEQENSAGANTDNVLPVENPPATEPPADNLAVQNPPSGTFPRQDVLTVNQEASSVSKCPPAKPKHKKQPVDKSMADNDALKSFDSLPDSARVDVKIVAAVVGCSVPTVWRRVSKGQLVAPVPNTPGTRTTRWLVGELREFLGLPTTLER